MTTLGVFRDDYYDPVAILPHAQYKTTTQNGGTFTAAQLVGAGDNFLAASGQTTAQAITLDTAVNIIAAIQAAIQSNANGAAPLPDLTNLNFSVTIINNNTSSGAITLTGGTGVTITGTNTIAITVKRTFIVSITSPTTVTFQNVGAGTP